VDYKFVEFQNFGANPLTVSFIGTVVCTVLQAWGLREQVKEIDREHSGTSIPAVTQAYFAAIFLATIPFGVRAHTLALIINGTLGIGYLLVYLAATSYADNANRRWWHALFALFIPIMAVCPDPDRFTFVLLGIGTLTIFGWPIKMYRSKTNGVVKIDFLWTFFASASFWLGYYWYVGIKPLFAINVVSVPTVFVTIVLWYWYARKERTVN